MKKIVFLTVALLIFGMGANLINATPANAAFISPGTIKVLAFCRDNPHHPSCVKIFPQCPQGCCPGTGCPYDEKHVTPIRRDNVM